MNDISAENRPQWEAAWACVERCLKGLAVDKITTVGNKEACGAAFNKLRLHLNRQKVLLRGLPPFDRQEILAVYLDGMVKTARKANEPFALFQPALLMARELVQTPGVQSSKLTGAVLSGFGYGGVPAEHISEVLQVMSKMDYLYEHRLGRLYALMAVLAHAEPENEHIFDKVHFLVNVPDLHKMRAPNGLALVGQFYKAFQRNYPSRAPVLKKECEQIRLCRPFKDITFEKQQDR